MLYINRASRSVREASVSDDGKLLFAETEHVTENRIKGSTDYGFRCIPLTGEAINLIESVHQQSPEQEYLFMYKDRQLTTITFNRHLKKVCEKLNIKYRPSRQIRFTNASIVFDNGVPIGELSNMMGHSNTSTTLHYLRKRLPSEDTVAKVQQALSI